MAMSDARFRQITSGVTDAAMKVYACVPQREYWTKQAIQREIVRTGVNMPPEAVSGCLGSLKSSGLIKENREGFCREPVKPAPAKNLADLAELIVVGEPAPKPKEEKTMATTAPPKLCAAETLKRLSQQLVVMAQRHRDEIEDFSSLLKDAAVEVQLEVEENAAGAEQFKKLQALLKGA